MSELLAKLELSVSTDYYVRDREREMGGQVYVCICVLERRDAWTGICTAGRYASLFAYSFLGVLGRLLTSDEKVNAFPSPLHIEPVCRRV